MICDFSVQSCNIISGRSADPRSIINICRLIGLAVDYIVDREFYKPTDINDGSWVSRPSGNNIAALQAKIANHGLW